MQWLSQATTPERAEKGGLERADAPAAITGEIRRAVGRVAKMGRRALLELTLRRIEDTEYALLDDRIEARSFRSQKCIPYADVERVVWVGRDRAHVVSGATKLTIKPLAYMVVGRTRVPIGWSRNGLEVPFRTLIEEIAARAGKEIETA